MAWNFYSSLHYSRCT